MSLLTFPQYMRYKHFFEMQEIFGSPLWLLCPLFDCGYNLFPAASHRPWLATQTSHKGCSPRQKLLQVLKTLNRCHLQLLLYLCCFWSEKAFQSSFDSQEGDSLDVTEAAIYLACPLERKLRRGLERMIITMEMCSAVKLKVVQHDIQHYVLGLMKSNN